MMEKPPLDKNVSSIGDVVQHLIKKIDEEKTIGEEELFKVWVDTVGVEASNQAIPTGLLRKKLRVMVKNSGWLQELSMDKRRILKKIQSHFGKDLIQDIQFRTGETD